MCWPSQHHCSAGELVGVSVCVCWLCTEQACGNPVTWKSWHLVHSVDVTLLLPIAVSIAVPSYVLSCCVEFPLQMPSDGTGDEGCSLPREDDSVEEGPISVDGDSIELDRATILSDSEPGPVDNNLPDDVMEVFSPPRVVRQATALGVRASVSVDLDAGFDLTTAHGRESCLALLHRKSPRLLVLSPPCTMFSALTRMWNARRMAPQTFQVRMQQAQDLATFAMHLAMLQQAAGRKWVFEHPGSASSWRDNPALAQAAASPNTFLSKFDQCRLGLRSPAGLPVKKRTHFLSNSEIVHASFHGRFCMCASMRGVVVAGCLYVVRGVVPTHVFWFLFCFGGCMCVVC